MAKSANAYGGGYPLGGPAVSSIPGQLQRCGRGVSVDHTTVSRWTQRYASEIATIPATRLLGYSALVFSL
jgi:hypothetical protein